MKTERVSHCFALNRFRAWSSVFLYWIATIAIAGHAVAQLPTLTTPDKTEPMTGNETATTMFPHPVDSRFWISGQMNFIFQANPPFSAEYTGTNSFRTHYEKATGHVLTFYGGLQVTKSTEVLLDFEETAGLGLSGAMGIAGFTNLDAVRDATLSDWPYLSRVMVHQVINLSHDKTDASRGPLSTFSRLPSRRLELRVGKFGMTDFFDANSIGSDSHLQFLNWAVDQNGAYDFTSDARGYTWGALAEYQSPKWGLRLAEGLLPGPNNGGPLVWNLKKANTTNAEFELHRGLVRKDAGVIRFLSYVNNANMGTYQYANEQYLEGKVPHPDISNHPLQVTTKYGFGVNMEEPMTKNSTVYGRFGWNNGKTESWCFTEIDQTFSTGVGFLGPAWKRSNDRAGLAFASNGISSEHARYLSDGGLGSVLGDGGLKYGRENIFESYYTAHLRLGIFAGPDFQLIVNPGYNQLRGPIPVASLRLHIEL